MSDGRILFLRQEDFENVYRRLDELTERVKEAHERINEMTACVLSPDLARKLQHAHDNPAPSAPSECGACSDRDPDPEAHACSLFRPSAPSGGMLHLVPAFPLSNTRAGWEPCLDRDKPDAQCFYWDHSTNPPPAPSAPSGDLTIDDCGRRKLVISADAVAQTPPEVMREVVQRFKEELASPPATARETVADQAWREYGAWVDQHKARCPDCEHDAVELTYLYAEYNRGRDECHGTVPASDPEDRHEAKPSTAREEWQCDYVYDYGDGKTNPCPYAKTQHNAPGIHEFVKHAPAKAESGKDERRWICTKCVACSCEENEADWIEVVSLAALEAEREKREAAERWEANWRTLHEDLLRRAEAERNEALNHYKEAAARADEVQRYYDEARATVERVRVLATSDLSPYYSYDGVPKSAILAALASEPKGKP